MRTVLNTFGSSFGIKTTGEGLKNLTGEIRKGLAEETESKTTELISNILISANYDRTAASDIFSQDLEDLPEEYLDTAEDKPVKEPVKQPQRKPQTVEAEVVYHCETCGVEIPEVVWKFKDLHKCREHQK